MPNGSSSSSSSESSPSSASSLSSESSSLSVSSLSSESSSLSVSSSSSQSSTLVDWLDPYTNRIKVIIDKDRVGNSPDLVNFPVMIYISASSGQSNQDLTQVFDELGSDANRKKIAVTTADGVTECYVEIERWDHSAEKAWLHTKIPIVRHGEDTFVYLYYDASAPDNTTYVGDITSTPAQNVWDDDFVFVAHMADVPSNTTLSQKESTDGAHHFRSWNMESADFVDALVGKGHNYDQGAVEWEDVPNHGELSFGNASTDSPLTFEVIADFHDVTNRTLFQKSQEYDFRSFASDKLRVTFYDDTFIHYIRAESADQTAYEGAFHYWGAVYDGQGDETGIDLQRDTTIITDTQTTLGTYVAMHQENANLQFSINGSYMDGVIDEVRLSKTDRSKAWRDATYYTLFDDFLTFGAEEESSSSSFSSQSSESVSPSSSSSAASKSSESSSSDSLSSSSESSLSLSSASSFSSESSSSSASKLLGVRSILTSFGEQRVRNTPVGFGIENKQGVLLTLSDPLIRAQTILQTIAQDPVTAVHSLLGEIADKDIVQRVISTFLTLGEYSLQFPTVDWDIFLDGNSIKGKVVTAQMIFDEENIHNQLTLDSIDKDLFYAANPANLPGTGRLEVHYGARVIPFLLESRSGDEIRFQLWGRGISARDDTPYSTQVDLLLTQPMLASAVADLMITVNAVDWQATDWMLPEDWDFHGDPVSGLQELAQAVGGIVRAEDDGTLTIRNRWTTRPINMPGATPDVSYDRVEDIVFIEQDTQRGNGFDSIEVIGDAPDVLRPDMELEESSPAVGDEVHVRVFWAGYIPDAVNELVTAGVMSNLGEYTTQFTELVVFQRKVGRTNRPVTDVLSTTWIGNDGGSVTSTNFEKEVRCSSDWAIGRVTYTSTYNRYRIYDHYVETLLSVLEITGARTIEVLVKIGEGLNPAPSLTNGNITSTEAAIAAGTAWLDQNRYDKKFVRIRVPHKVDALDGAVAYINDAEIECTGNFKIGRVEIHFNGPQVVHQIEVAQCQV